MRHGKTINKALAGLALLSMSLTGAVDARSPDAGDRHEGRRAYVVTLREAPLAAWHRGRVTAPEQAPKSAGAGKRAVTRAALKPDFASPEARAYLRSLDEGFEAFRGEATLKLKREIDVRRRFRNALNGFSTKLTAEEARKLAEMPEVSSVEIVRDHRPQTDAGPTWIGAARIWDGEGSLLPRKGEGIVVGVIDSGINWEHISFADPGGNAGSHDFVNPFGSEKGLCSDPEVECNDKLIGVYDFVEDDPDTDTVEENTKGRDNSGHGTHVASTAVGNTLRVSNNGIPFDISGVAPNANLVSYRVCYEGDPDDTEDDSCDGSAILDAIDQAVEDGVDVINYSLGTDATISPWNSSVATAFLNAFGTGIFVATSASNDGPGASTIGSPAHAPWIMSVGNATHNRIFGAVLENLVGGATTPPDDIIGATLTDTSGFRPIVYARDYGNALCGTGTEELGQTCDDNTGSTNPFAPGTFNGEIVVCDRGQYGRVEKGRNLQLAGAGGMILANTDDFGGESVISDEHCIPSIHVGATDGNLLRAWLDSGSGHMGNITGFDRIVADEIADQVASSSSRGPGLPPVEDVLKPNLIAPGQSILGSYFEGNQFAFLSGTSMASPHVAGAAALLLSVNTNWSPSRIASAMQMTATPELATDFDGTVATPHERGAGRPRLFEAAQAGLFLDETVADFQSANPASGGEPRNLNLPSLADAACESSCSFTRTVTDLVGGRSWTAAASGFPAGVEVTVTPSAFNLSQFGSASLDIDVDLSGAPVIGTWVYGSIVLSASGVPDATLPVALFATGGDLPVEWNVFAHQSSGYQDFTLDGLIDMPQATFTAGGLVAPETDSQFLPEDPSRDDPYDGGTGVMTVLVEVPEDSLWLHAETLDSSAPDLDLFVGRDNNHNGVAEESEEICSSTTPFDNELCDILNPSAGDYWILVQNWSSSASNNDEATLVTAVVGPGTGDYPLTATGPGMTTGGETFDVRVSWNDVPVVEGTDLFGAVGVGTHAGTPANVGVIPVYWNRLVVDPPETLALMDGHDHGLVIAGSSTHDLAFIDVPPGATKLSVTAEGGDSVQNAGLAIELHRVAFDDAFQEAPLAAPAPGGTPVASATGSAGGGPQVEVSGGSLQEGRWYAVLRNTNPQSSSVTLRADVAFSGAKLPVNGNLLVSVNRGQISQGIDYQPVGPTNGLIWYTYTEDHWPAWYLSASAAGASNIWTGNLLRFTNDGSTDRFTPVGKVAVTMLGDNDSVFSWSLFGESGSERMGIVTGSDTNPCPSIGGSPTSVSGFWGKAQPGLGGASVLMTDAVHAEIHYLYDGSGNPVWLQAAGASGNELTLSQFTGFCPTCASSPVSSANVGVLTHHFMSESAADWTLNYLLNSPLTGDVNRSDDIIKLSDVRNCD